MDVVAAATCVSRRREGGEQQHLGDRPGRRAGLNRSHRASVSVGTWRSDVASSLGLVPSPTTSPSYVA
jgi:hypothetical protein